jgi:hypothetical protein
MKLLHTFGLVASLAVAVLGLHGASHPHAGPSAPVAAFSPDADAGDRARHGDISDARQAKRVLASLAAEYRHLDGVTVEMGATPNGAQAVAYYESGRIVIDRAHQATIEKKLAHEVWHVIDWRDNGTLDWGEDIPPASADDYRAQ